MSTPSNGSEPSMEEILASIRALVSQDPAQQAAQPATPVLPHPAQQPATGEPSLASPARPDRQQPSLPSSGGPALSLPAVPAPQNSQSAPARSDEDDLADLLDDPLPAADPSPASAAAAAPVKAGWNAGALGATATDAAGNGPAANSTGTVAAAISFDFGSMVPSRDPPPRKEVEGAPMPALSRFPSSDFKAEPAARAPADSISAGWPPSMRGGESAAAHRTGLAADTAAPSASPEAPSSSASAPKPAAIGSDRLPNPVANKPAVDVSTPLADGAAALQGPGRFFSAPLTGYSGATGSKEKPASAPDEKKHAATEPVRADAPADKAAAPAGREDAPSSSSLLTRGPGAPSQAPAAQTDSAAKYPGVEPFLKAFGMIDPKGDRPNLGQTAGSPIASGAKAEFGANLAKSAPAASPAPEPAAGSNEAPATPLRDGGGSRTLEETVMELLRPMLREWVDENLPRIVEDAVRREVAGAIKSKVDPTSKI